MSIALGFYTRILVLVQPTVRTITTTPVVFAAPLRKKKVVNPLITKKQFDRKVRRLEKEIDRLQSIAPKLKPILEMQLPPHVVRELEKRQRPKPDADYSHKLLSQYYKAWAIYKGIESKQEMQAIKSVVGAQNAAMNVLRNEYPELYRKAIEIDPELIPYRVENVKKHTPPNEAYKCPDGRLADITKEWKL